MKRPIVIARLRIAGSQGGGFEDPDSAPRGRVRTPYDEPSDKDAHLDKDAPAVDAVEGDLL